MSIAEANEKARLRVIVFGLLHSAEPIRLTVTRTALRRLIENGTELDDPDIASWGYDDGVLTIFFVT